ncbi:MAG TPA: sugar ABC transporter ATP-binding protein [Solirubrobacteraceae bacterium]|nr:sugar ABC transporter ATP-binding protein [Solirubrobacteraceae bacterium]
MESALEIRAFRKSFAGARALDGVDFTVAAGEVHALVGQNGAGKSTLIKLVSGYLAPDAGDMAVGGRPVPLPYPPGRARSMGLGFFHQNLSMNPSLSILENMRVGRYRSGRLGRIRWRSEREQARRALETVGLDLDPRLPISRTTPGERALIAFARARQDVDDGGRVLILDEPTPYLSRAAVETMYGEVRALSRRGISTVFVSHRLDEVMTIADRISVLRDGRMLGTVRIDEIDEPRLVRMMLGRDLGQLYPERNTVEAGEDSVLSVTGLTGEGVDGVDLTLRKGEILGLTGLLGMGQDVIPYLLFGAANATGGVVGVRGENVAAADLSPARARELGLALLPAVRATQSGFPEATVMENLSMPVLDRFVRGGLLRRGLERPHVARLLAEFDVQPRDPDRELRMLSGGNQQKVLLAKWLQLDPRILLLHEPTQGVDVGSRQQVFRAIHRVADRGTSVVIASSEYEDLAQLCHRVLILRNGRVVRELTGANLTTERIIEQSYLTPRQEGTRVSSAR